MIDSDLMPGALIAALGAASIITNQLARRATTHTRQYRLHTAAAWLNATGFAVTTAAVITGHSAHWAAVAVFFLLGYLGSCARRRMALDEAAMEAAMTAAIFKIGTTPTKETNR